MRKGAKKGGKKGVRRGSGSTSSATASQNEDTTIVENVEATTTQEDTQPTPKPTPETTVVKVEPPDVKEEDAKEEAQEEKDAKPKQEMETLKVNPKEVAKGASSSSFVPLLDDDESDPDDKPLVRRSKRDRSASKEPEKKSPASNPKAKRAKTTSKATKEAEIEYFKEKRRLEDLWKDAFPVGTEWAQLEELYESKWDFTNLEEALEEGGKLYGKNVYVFGCTESHPVINDDEEKTVLVPAVVCVESSIPPSDRIGTTLAQDDVEQIIPMKDMKMAWVPYIPLDKRDRQVDRVKFKIFVLGCTQRRTAVKHLKDDRVKKFNSCLPYINNPYKEDESEQSTVAKITFPSEPPVILQYDWATDNLEEFTNELIKQEEAILADRQDEFKEFVKEESGKARTAFEEAEQAREAAKEGLSEATKEAYKAMKLYKFYPLPSSDTPYLSAIEKSSLINKYFGKADEVL